MVMQLSQLRSFVTLAEVRHFTHAADVVGVTQPSLSKQIQVLEESLGAALVNRERGAVTLTPAGELLLPLARRVLADVDTARREVQQLVGLRRGRLRIGATPSLCTSLVAEVLRRYRAAYPGVDLVVEENGSKDLERDLAGGALDLALIITPGATGDPALRTAPILKEDLVVASARALPPPGPDPMRVADLRDVAMVMFRAGYDLRDATLHLCHEEGFAPRFAVEGGEMDSVLAFVEAGLGVALVPSMVLAARPALRATVLQNPGAQRTIALAHRRATAPTHTARAFRSTLAGYVAEASAAGTLPAGVEAI